MVQLVESDIQTSEVLDWQGVHVLHFVRSSCSQKLRIFLNLKGIPWTSHPIDLLKKENLTPWYMGINPRGLVPTLVHNGQVHIESNDIMLYLEQQFPESPLIPEAKHSDIAEMLHHEDELHLDLRNISLRFVYAPPKSPKSAEDLERYAATGSGSVGGQKDSVKDKQTNFWNHYLTSGITDKDACQSVTRFRVEFEKWEQMLVSHPYLLGDALTVLDIAWFVYAKRLSLAGYPLARLHPRLHSWFEALYARPEFSREVAPSPELQERIAQNRAAHLAAGKALEQIAKLQN